MVAFANGFTFKLKLMDPMAQYKLYFALYFHNNLRELNLEAGYLANIDGSLKACQTRGRKKKEDLNV